MAKSNPRRTNSTRRNNLRKRIKDLGLPCAICGKPIDYSLPARDPMSYELDEIIPVSRGGDPLDINNVQPAHRCCNLAKSNKIMNKRPIKNAFPTSRKWVG